VCAEAAIRFIQYFLQSSERDCLVPSEQYADRESHPMLKEAVELLQFRQREWFM
jgi:hypothetical protein